MPASAFFCCFLLLYQHDLQAAETRVAAAEAEMQTAIDAGWSASPAQFPHQASDLPGQTALEERKGLPDDWATGWIPKISQQHEEYSQIVFQRGENYNTAGGMTLIALQNQEKRDKENIQRAETRARQHCATYDGQDMKGHDIVDGVHIKNIDSASLVELCCQECINNDDCAART